MNKRAKTDFMIAGFCIVVFAAITLGVTHKARSQDHSEGHAQYHDVYKNWSQPGLREPVPGSCCNERKTDDQGNITGDCYPTQARIVQGHWVARRDDGVWLDIPNDKIIHERNPGSEDAQLCYAYGNVLCFVPPDTGG